MAQHDSEGVYIPAEHTDDDIPSSLCRECKFYDPTEKISNCYDENSFQVFCITHKIWAVIVNCEGFKDKNAVEEPKVIPGHEFENDVMKSIEQQTQEAEIEVAMANRTVREDKELELKEKGGKKCRLSDLAKNEDYQG